MNRTQPNVASRYKTLIVLWAALLLSQFMLLFVVFMTKGELFRFDLSQSVYVPSWPMILGFAVGAVMCFIFSFAFKKRFFQRAEEEQNPDLVQTGFIIACALCEASTLFGLALAFGFDYQYFFAWFVLGIVGILLHFPRQSALLLTVYRQK